jgi:pyruvate/2-oxoglutarate dehydrogenase complex dihydrolipoamide acyltransferase (E2) component
MARFRLLDPWYEKITAGYNLEFRAEVERIHDRFAVEGIADESLKVPAQGRLARKEIRGIASKLWELAYKLRDKEVEIEEA